MQYLVIAASFRVGVTAVDAFLQKEPNARRFGILPSCSHCFCVACIRQWRSSSQFEPKVTR